MRPRALTRAQGRPTLLLDDPGGDLLVRLIGKPWEVTPFLRVAISLAVGLGRLHRQGLVHKDVKPANILANRRTGEVWLTGFGFTLRLPRERQAPEPPEVIAGTLAYMAPEQTGRMNRSIDSRSDLYACGVTLYELLTGVLPFVAAEPMEWIHCHIARYPEPPAERVKGIPRPLSAIVLKLLAKTAEDRYQTAAGLEVDLRKCLAEWEARGWIDPFPLGAHDIPDQLIIPERLYGRENQIQILLSAFDRVLASGKSEFVLVSGYSGIGKSSVVHELHKALVPPRALFASGKFDRNKRDVPYATLAQAFQSLIRTILGRTETELDKWRDELREALGPNGQIIVNLISELELIIGKQLPVAYLPLQDERNRFQTVFRRFVSVFAQPDHPLVLFLDDLQWLDTATLGLLEHLVTEPEVKHLLVIGAYRDNEVSAAHPLMRTLEAIRAANARVHDIVLAPLALDDVVRLVSETVHCEREEARPLAQLVYEKTAGNPFFAIQFLTGLAEERLIAFDPDTTSWSCDLGRMRAKGYTDNVLDFMIGKLTRLPAMTQEVLKWLACLGNRADTATLALVQGLSKDEMHEALWEAVRAGLVCRQYEAYTFLHDRVQEAAYALIPAGERAAVHLRLGRLLATSIPAEKREEAIFEIVNQLNRGTALITSPEERAQVAALNLTAGTRAKAATAYASALTCLAAGEALLPDGAWEQHYALAFAIAFHGAECEFLTGNLSAAEERLSALSRRAANLLDRAAVTCLRAALYTTLDRPDQAINVCLEHLQHVGIEWSPCPTKEKVKKEYNRLRQQIGSRTIESLIDLPAMSDPKWLTAMDVLLAVLPPARFTDANLHALATVNMANLSLEHGNCDGSCLAYAELGTVLGPHFGDYQSGFRFGQLGLELVDQRGLDRFKARVYTVVAYHVLPWTHHLNAARALMRRAFDEAQESGDLTFAAYSSVHLIALCLVAGDPLGDVQKEAENGIEFARKVGFGLIVDCLVGQLSLIQALRGLKPNFAAFPDTSHHEETFEQHLERDPRLATAACWYWIRKLQACLYAGDYASAIESAAKAQRLFWTGSTYLELAEYHFFGALAHAASHNSTSAEARPKHLEALIAHHKQLVSWAENCPENFGDRASLVAAEIARIEGRHLDAEKLYEQAIHQAREHGFIQNEALANERAAHFYAVRGFDTIAHAYLRNARYCYLRWGADGKVRQLDQLYPHLRQEPALPRADGTIGAPIEHLDLATVVKVSQAVSSEIDLKKLIDALMVTAVEHSGAERGLLILPRGDALQIEAEATTARDRVEVRLRHAVVTPSELPETVLHYVIRTQESMMLDDAAAPNQFSMDEHLRQTHSRSILCLPLVKQAKLIGVLYLENHLTPHVFTPARLAVLQLLASQAAISLENARLYTDLQHENRERQRAEERVRRSEAYLAEAQRLSLTGSFGWNVSSGEIFWSDETYRMLGIERATTPTLDWIFQRIHPEDIVFVQETLERASRDGADLDFEHRFVLPGGSVKDVHVVAQAVRDEKGHLEYVGAVMDVTAPKRSQQALERAFQEMQALRDQHRLVIDTIPGLVWSTLPDGQADFLNQRWREYTGLSLEEALGWGWRAAFHPEDCAILDWWNASLAAGEPFEAEARMRRADGEYRWFLIRSVPMRDELGNIVRWYRTNTDIEDRKQAEALLAGEKRLLEIIVKGNSLALILDALCRLVEELASGSLSSILLLDPNGSRLWHGAAPSLPASYTEAIDGSVIGPSAGSCGTAAYRGEPVIVSDIATDPLWANYRDLALAHGLRACWSMPILSSHGRVLGTFAIYSHEPCSPTRQQHNIIEQISHLASIAIERQRAEDALHHTQAELAHVTRVATLGEMTASIAHEINQPLAAVVNNASACLRWLAAQNLEEARQSAALVVADGHRAGEIVGRIRALAKKAPLQKEWLDLNETIREVIALARSEVQKNGVSLQTRLSDNIPLILGDRIHLQQVLLNLMMNAIEAMSGVNEGPRELWVSSEKSEAKDILIAVRDSGPGLDPQSLAHLFNAFYTTKPQGMGMGLAISRSIVEAHGGRLWATANAPHGAVFQFTLPIGGERVA